jgi:glycosyltransferase involved in cell wall biosynthesis
VPHHEIARAYQGAHLMLNVSGTGSLDKAVLEAMACGLPVITANEAYTPLLHNWRDQLLIPPDAPDMLADKIQAMMKRTPDARRALGDELRAIVVRDHSLDRLAGVLMNVLGGGE